MKIINWMGKVFEVCGQKMIFLKESSVSEHIFWLAKPPNCFSIRGWLMKSLMIGHSTVWKVLYCFLRLSYNCGELWNILSGPELMSWGTNSETRPVFQTSCSHILHIQWIKFWQFCRWKISTPYVSLQFLPLYSGFCHHHLSPRSASVFLNGFPSSLPGTLPETSRYFISSFVLLRGLH